jgi:rSAM/selenodomain-associated transferase 2
VRISVVIPTLDEERTLRATLESLARAPGLHEVIVADGGSRDATARVAQVLGARVVDAEPGRGVQLHAGAAAATGDVLWFLHADTLAPADAAEAIRGALADRRACGGNFRIVFDGDRPAARFLTWLYPRLRLIGLCYGDSGIFVRREAYDRVGGFRPYPLFEDLDLVRRVRRGARFPVARAAVVSSSRRFEGRSFALTFARWSMLQILYWAGVPPARLAAYYAHRR